MSTLGLNTHVHTHAHIRTHIHIHVHHTNTYKYKKLKNVAEAFSKVYGKINNWTVLSHFCVCIYIVEYVCVCV